jgi:hypothetical protein
MEAVLRQNIYEECIVYSGISDIAYRSIPYLVGPEKAEPFG